MTLPEIGRGPVSRATLIVRYKESSTSLARPDASCGCSAPEEPDFVWVVGRNIDPALGVPLARLIYQSSDHAPTLEEGFLFPTSRPFARPRVGSGATVPGDTRWEPWVENIPLLKEPVSSLGMQVTVDTSAAGFTETPCYFAWLGGMLWDRSNVEFFPAPLAHVDREETGRFRFRLWLPPFVLALGARLREANSEFADEFINYARAHGLHVCWVGIQPWSAPKTC
jgi:hypothetical protein